MLGRVVPWLSWEEWEETYRWLFSPNPYENSLGVQRVAAWHIRGRLPMSVESTAALVEAKLMETTLSDHALRMQLALSITRLVNGVVDPSQKSKYAQSVAGLASAAGLPRILVDIRHKATHNELPTLYALRLAADSALAWLQAGYWQRQLEHLEACNSKLQQVFNDTVASWTKHYTLIASGGRRPTQGDDDEDGAAPGPANNAAAKKEEKKARLALLAELHGLVLAPATADLVPMLLDLRVMQPPAAVGGGEGAGKAGGIDLKQKRADMQRSVWESLVSLFLSEWPTLPAHLLCGAVERLSGKDPVSQSDAGGAAAAQQRAAALATWVDTLMASGPSAGSFAAPTLSGLASEVASSYVALMRSGDRATGAGTTAGPALLQALRSIAAAARSGSTSGSGAKTRARLSAIVDHVLSGAWAAVAQPASVGVSLASGEAPSTANKRRRLASGSAAAAAAAPGPAASAASLLAAAREAAAAEASLASALDAAAEPSPWSLCADWEPCALGTLPHPLRPTGRPCALDPPGAQGAADAFAHPVNGGDVEPLAFGQEGHAYVAGRHVGYGKGQGGQSHVAAVAAPVVVDEGGLYYGDAHVRQGAEGVDAHNEAAAAAGAEADEVGGSDAAAAWASLGVGTGAVRSKTGESGAGIARAVAPLPLFA